MVSSVNRKDKSNVSKESKTENMKSTKYDNATHVSINPKPPLLIRLFGHSLFLILFISIISTFIEPFDVTILLPLYRDNYMQSKFDPIKKYILKDILLSSDYFHQLKHFQNKFHVNNNDDQVLKQYMKLQSNIDSDFSSLVELILGDDTTSLPSSSSSSSSSITQSFDYSIASFFNFFSQPFRNNNKFDILNYIVELEQQERKFNITILSPQDESLWSSESTLLRFIVSNPYERYRQSSQSKESDEAGNKLSNSTNNKNNSRSRVNNMKSKTRRSSRKSFLEYNITLDGMQLLFPESQQYEFNIDSIVNSITNKSNNYNTSVSGSDGSTNNQTSINNNNHRGNFNNNKSNSNCRNIISLEIINNLPIDMGVDLLQHGLKAGPHYVTVDILLDMQGELWGAHAMTYFYYFPSNAELHIRHTDGTSRPFSTKQQSSSSQSAQQQEESIPSKSQSSIQSVDYSKHDSVTTSTITNQHTATDRPDSINSDGNYFIPSTSEAVIGWRKTNVNDEGISDGNNINNDIATDESTHSSSEKHAATVAVVSSTSPLSSTHPVVITSPRNHDAVEYKFTLQGSFPTIYLSYSGLRVVLQHNDQQIFDLTERVREQQQGQGQPQQQSMDSLSELQLTVNHIQDVASFKIDLEGLEIGTHTMKIHLAEVETASSVVTSKGEQPVRIVVTSEIITFYRV